MNDPNRLMKWLMVIGMVVLAMTILYPPSEKLKGGIDLVGGTSLLFEIDSSGLSAADQRGLSTRVMNILKERVDPKGQLNLEWRPVGNTRLEIRMPRPPKEALARRELFNTAMSHLNALNISRREVEQALNAAPDEREAGLAALERGVAARSALLSATKDAFAAYQSVDDPDDYQAVEAATGVYEEAMTAVLKTSLPTSRLRDVLALSAGTKRDEELSGLRASYAAYDAGDPGDPNGKLLTKTVEAYDAWAKNKGDLEDPSDLKRRLRGAGVLEFRILGDRDPSSPAYTTDANPQLRQPVSKYTEQLARYGPRPRGRDRYRWFAVDDIRQFMDVKNPSEIEAARMLPGRPIVEEYAGRWYTLVHADPEYGMLHGALSGKKWKLESALPDRNPMTGENVVTFALDARGGRLFGELTGTNIGRSLCIMLDNTAVSHAVIKERITDRCQISGRFTSERVQDLVQTLEAGSLPARVKETPLSEKTIGPSLGESNRVKGIQAAAWGAVCVAVFMLIYYGFVAGGMADIALAMNLLFVLSLMALMQATFTLPGIAGLILTVGMAVDANVLIFERIREEVDRGIIFRKAVNLGYDKALSTILDANITTLITCVILGFVGSEEVKGFAIVLGIGITTSMFTALFVTRLVFNTLIAKGLLKQFRMLRIIGRPSVDWIALRRIFWPVSTVVVILGVTIFLATGATNKEALYDIEFLGGTSVQIDFKPGVVVTDQEVARSIRAADGSQNESAVQWLRYAAEQLRSAEIAPGQVVGQFVISSSGLTGAQIVTLMFTTLEDKLDRDGVRSSGRSATFDGKPNELTLEKLVVDITLAAKRAETAAERLRSARVQGVGDIDAETGERRSYEVVTTETDRALVQGAIVAVMGDRLAVQQAISFSTVRDEQLTKDDFFIVETEDHYLSDVIGGDANFDVRRYRGGVAIEIVLDEFEEPLSVAMFEKRLLEVSLQPEFEDYQGLDTAVFPLGAADKRSDGESGYRRFAVAAVDDDFVYEEDMDIGRWREAVALPQLALVQAALGSEKSLSKVIQFAPQIAGQARNRALMSVVLALFAIVTYLWLRFGSKEYGLAAIVALVHDVAITLGLVAASYYVFDTFAGKALLIDNFKVDLPMIAAVLTVIGYSLNDTIVVFDRIRENRGKVSALSTRIINTSINQTLSRTVLTSVTTFMVVLVLYVFGGKGVHGFSFALLIGVVVGTYSSIGIATPLLQKPRLLRGIIGALVASAVIGFFFANSYNPTTRWVGAGVVATIYVVSLVRGRASSTSGPTGHPARA